MNQLQQFKAGQNDVECYINLCKAEQFVGVIYKNYDIFKEKCQFCKIDRAGYVYVIEMSKNRLKIGATTNPLKRILDLNLGSKIHSSKKLNRIFVSNACVNFRKIESDFKKTYECKNEVFTDISLEDFLFDFIESGVDFNIQLHYLNLHIKKLQSANQMFQSILCDNTVVERFNLLQQIEYSDYLQMADDGFKHPQYKEQFHSGTICKIGSSTCKH